MISEGLKRLVASIIMDACYEAQNNEKMFIPDIVQRHTLKIEAAINKYKKEIK